MNVGDVIELRIGDFGFSTERRYLASENLNKFVKMLKETSAVVQKAINGHKTLEQMKQAKILAPWDKFGGAFINSGAFIETLYNSLTAHKGEFVKHN